MIQHFTITLIVLLLTAEYLRLVFIYHGRLNIHLAATIVVPGYVAYWLLGRDTPAVLAHVLAVAAAATTVFVLDRLITWLAPPENRAAPMVGTLASIGFLIILSNGAVAVWGSLPYVLHKAPTVLLSAPVVSALVAVLVLYAILRVWSKTGLVEHAAADDRFLLLCYGFPVRRVLDLVSLVGGVAIGFCGILLAHYIGVSPFVAYDYIFPAIGIAYVAGPSGFVASLLASVCVSLLLVLSSLALSDDWVRVLAFASLGIAVVSASRLRAVSNT